MEIFRKFCREFADIYNLAQPWGWIMPIPTIATWCSAYFLKKSLITKCVLTLGVAAFTLVFFYFLLLIKEKLLEESSNYGRMKRFLRMKLNQAYVLSRDNNIDDHKMGLWYEKLREGLRRAHRGGVIPEGDITDSMRVIDSRIEGSEVLNLEIKDLQSAIEDCSDQVLLISFAIKPYLILPDSEPIHIEDCE